MWRWCHRKGGVSCWRCRVVSKGEIEVVLQSGGGGAPLAARVPGGGGNLRELKLDIFSGKGYVMFQFWYDVYCMRIHYFNLKFVMFIITLREEYLFILIQTTI